MSERSTCSRLAHYIELQLEYENVSGYYADVEYNRKQRGKVKTIIINEEQIVSITPDLIVHSRGEIPAPNDNMIAVEAKKSSRPTRGKEDDTARLIAMTREPYNGVWNWEDGHPEHVCGYAVGIFMEIRREAREVLLEYFKRGQKTKEQLFTIPVAKTQQAVPAGRPRLRRGPP
ncbi:MAG TPA: hypothetical protein VGE57_14500 [Solimonas sp.]